MVKFSFFASLTIAMGFMMSPESLTMLGNNMGQAGIPFVGALVLAGMFYMMTAHTFHKAFSLFSGPAGEALLIRQVLGSIPAAVFPLSARVTFALFASAAMLITAGFVFNEVFVYWFPNFTFAYLLLGFLLVMNLLGQVFAEKLQVFSIIAVLTGLFALSIIGLASETTISAEQMKSSTLSLFPTGIYAVLLFIGFDLAFMQRIHDSDHDDHSVIPIISGIVLATLIFCLWGLASIMHVSSGRLAETTIPHTLAARKIFGQNGRLIMGVVIIAGTISAVNALLLGISRMISGMAMEGLLPAVLQGTEKRAPVSALVMAIGIALMMASGIAGKPEIVLYVRAGLLLWLLNYMIVFLCMILMKSGPQPLGNPSLLVVNLIGFAVSGAVLISLLSTYTDPAALLKCMLVMLGVWFILSIVWNFFVKRGGEVSL